MGYLPIKPLIYFSRLRSGLPISINVDILFKMKKTCATVELVVDFYILYIKFIKNIWKIYT